MAAARDPRDPAGSTATAPDPRTRHTPVPDAAPALAPGLTAWHWQWACIAAAAGIPLAAAGFALVSALAAASAAVLAGLALIAVHTRYTETALSELDAGYLTSHPLTGHLAWNLHADCPARHRRAPWDCRGLWLLDPVTGDAHHGPQAHASAPAPGWYPSPHADGRREMWSGAAWTGQLQPLT